MERSQKLNFGILAAVVIVVIILILIFRPEPLSNNATADLSGTAPPMVSIHWTELRTGYPEAMYADTVISYEGFDLGYNEAYEQAAWVVYVLTRKEVEDGVVARTDNFRSDPFITTGSAELSDYRGSGFDRGHLAPAGDMKWSDVAMSESFLLSNMSPQYPSFNRGIWKKLEEQVREWAVEKDSIYVITGPVLSSVDTLIGSNEVGVPGYYFKVLVDLSPPDHSMTAFILANKKSSEDLDRFVITVDSLEVLTGYNFFSGSPDQEMIEWIESDLTRW